MPWNRLQQILDGQVSGVRDRIRDEIRAERDRNPFHGIDHITKLDPDKPVAGLDTILDSGTDAVMIGGSQGVTPAKITGLMNRVDAHDSGVPVYLEPGDTSDIDDGGYLDVVARADELTVPSVRNTADETWTTGKHADFYAAIHDEITERPGRVLSTFLADDLPAGVPGTVRDWAGSGLVAAMDDDGRAELERLMETYLHAWMAREQYLVCNPDSAVGRKTGPFTYHALDGNEAALRDDVEDALRTRPEAVYVEYSGTFGDPSLVGAVRDAMDTYGTDAALVYGGGIKTADAAETMYRAGADVLVVGDFAHDDPAGFRDTVPD